MLIKKKQFMNDIDNVIEQVPWLNSIPHIIANVTREPLMYLYMSHKAKPKEMIPLGTGQGNFKIFPVLQKKENAIRIEAGEEFEGIRDGKR